MIICFREDKKSEQKIIEKQDNLGLDSDNYDDVVAAQILLKKKSVEEKGNPGFDSNNYNDFLAECDEIGVPFTLSRPEWIIPSTLANESLTL